MPTDPMPDIQRLHSRGLSVREIALELGMEVNVVARLVLLHRLRPADGSHSLSMSATEVETIKEMARQGITPAEMSEATLLSQKTIITYLNEAGISYVSQSEARDRHRQQQMDAIKELLDNGATPREICLSLGMPEGRYRRLKNEMGLGRGKVTAVDDAAVKKLHKRGLSEAAIAAELGVTRRRIRSALLQDKTNPKEPKHGVVGGVWMSRGCECSLCTKARAIIRQELKSKNDATAEEATNSWKEWTGPELEIVARDDLTAKQKAKMLKRTMYSVQAASHRIHHDPAWIEGFGVKIPEPKKRYRATPKDIDIMLDRSRKVSDIATQLGCSESLVVAYRNGKVKGGR